MKKPVIVREFAKLTTCEVEPSLDRASVSKSAFDYLCRLAGQFRASGAQLLEVEGSQWLRLDNFVGILETPCGTTLEILPKHFDADGDEEDARKLLMRMIQAALDLPTRQVGPADLALFKAPLSEWVRREFLRELEHLVKRGMKFDYLRIEEEQRHLRGQLDLVRQLRQTPDRSHYFHMRHDVFSLVSPENRLLKTALVRVAASTEDPSNWRLSHELLQVLAEVPRSLNLSADFKAWRGGRLMAHYVPILPWCELVLRQHVPLAVSGDWNGMSMLFPMEKLFERFVEAALRRSLRKSAHLKSQSRNKHLCEHEGKGFFQLRPDLTLDYSGRRTILDAKWKLLNAGARDKKYGIAQGDFYQLFAYGHKYAEDGQPDKELVLIYPQTSTFTSPLPPFVFSPGLQLWVLPFELGATPGAEKLIVPDGTRLAEALMTSDADSATMAALG